MNYQKLYDLIIADARTNPSSGYTESHHIVPRCMGGGNEKTNRVRLTARQHFVVHRLLTKIYPEHLGLRFAFNLMFKSSKRANRLTDLKWVKSISVSHTYEYHKIAHRLAQSARITEWYKHNKHPRSGAVLSEETKRLISIGNLGNQKMLGKVHSAETKAKIAATKMGKLRSSQSIARQQASRRTSKKIGKYYQITTPTNETIIIQNLNEFARTHGLNISTMKAAARGKLKSCKGYSVIRFDPGTIADIPHNSSPNNP